MADHYEIVTYTSYLGITALNRFWYQATDVGNSIDGATAAFINVIPQQIRQVMHTGAVLNQIITSQYTNTFTKVGEKTYGANYVGMRTGEAGPPYAAWGFKLLSDVVGGGLRNGSKRFVGVSEADMVNGVSTGSIIAQLLTLQNGLRATLTNLAIQYRPEIIHKVVPAVPASWVWTLVANASYRWLTTQSSRKFGKGI